jgi:FtsP/CotA-like multicopper oxidase with cupredoxin domain
MAPHESVDIAFVADNPGDWMFHCHILEHQAAGMTGVIRVA